MVLHLTCEALERQLMGPLRDDTAGTTERSTMHVSKTAARASPVQIGVQTSSILRPFAQVSPQIVCIWSWIKPIASPPEQNISPSPRWTNGDAFSGRGGTSGKETHAARGDAKGELQSADTRKRQHHDTLNSLCTCTWYYSFSSRRSRDTSQTLPDALDAALAAARPARPVPVVATGLTNAPSQALSQSYANLKFPQL
jgi:hypothetical protein